MRDLLDLFFLRNWWIWQDSSNGPWSVAYHWFNIFEGCAWVVFGALVFRRYYKHRRSRLELWYALSFFTFGLTDFREAWVQQSWLIWLKAVNLVALLWLRALVIRRHYPRARVF